MEISTEQSPKRSSCHLIDGDHFQWLRSEDSHHNLIARHQSHMPFELIDFNCHQNPLSREWMLTKAMTA